MADCAAIKAQLDEALDARRRLLTNRSIRVVVDTDGSRIEYNATNLDKLNAYIQQLQVDYDKCIGAPIAAMTRPLRFIF